MSPHIAFDIQFEIIKRIPVKSLLRFRSVCKAWKSLIDSSEFIAGYSVPNTQPQHLLMKYEVADRQVTGFKCVCFVDDDTFPRQTFTPTVPPLLEELYLSRIIESSHGVLCFYGFYHPKKGDLWPNYLIDMALLWNPSIRKSTAVVVPKVISAHFSSVLGFGVCPNTCDPMLVYVTFISTWSNPKVISCIPCQVLVFKLSSGEWECLSGNLPRKSIGFTWSSAVIGQFIYWFAYDRIDENGGLRNLIMAFDMVSDEFIEIALPDSLAHLPDDLDHLPELAFSISKLRESLVVLEYTKNTSKHQVCGVWMMEHGDPKWFTKLYTIEAPYERIERTLGFSKSGKPIIEKDFDFFGHFDLEATLAVYEPCTEQIKDLEIHVTDNSVFVNSYTESLLLLHEEDGLIYSM
ncbi:putative F-box protein At3g16590 [Cynara cardunculus var. scolymus]|uniref:putative F-box protein At3g16590 n=1 Tax=Cynara cardunculus var. scolymus TaxID=59895 RepID=UPI000D6292B6|nr:putative F-box protein At3g16590 [Cynara cardunculus var. scolymus]